MKLIRYCIVIILTMSFKGKDYSLANNEFKLNGTVTNMVSGNLYAIGVKDGQQKIDTLKIEKGHFIYTGVIEGGVKLIYLSTIATVQSQNDPYVELYLEPGIMELELDARNLKGAKLTGSKTMDEQYVLESLLKKISDKFKVELDALEKNSVLFMKASSEEEKKELKWKGDELKGALEPYYKENKDLLMQFINDNPQSYISFKYFISTLRNLSQKEAHNIYNKFPEVYKNSPEGKRIEKEIEAMSKGIPGAIAGDFNTIDINGEPLKLADFKGHYLLIDFWASWCVPCRKGNPHLLKLYTKYKPKGLEILGSSDDDRNPDAWRKAVKADGIGVWRHVLRGMKIDRSKGKYEVLDGGISATYNIHALPTKILINPEGIIVGRYGGGGEEDDDAMDKKLAEIFD